MTQTKLKKPTETRGGHEEYEVLYIDENNKTAQPPVINSLWLKFWAIYALVSQPLILIIYFFVKFPQKSYFAVILSFAISVIVFLFVSMHNVSGGHNFFKHVISHIGRVHQKDKSNPEKIVILDNKKAAYLFYVFCTSYAGLFLTLGTLLKNYYTGPNDAALQWTSIVCLIGALAGMMMAVIPLDITRWGHLIFALVVFLCTLFINIFVFAYFVDVHGWYYWYFQIFGIFNMFTSFMYIVTYLSRRNAPFWQKSTIISTTISLVIYGIAFSLAGI